jgi:hypothetical protein
LHFLPFYLFCFCFFSSSFPSTSEFCFRMQAR